MSWDRRVNLLQSCHVGTGHRRFGPAIAGLEISAVLLRGLAELEDELIGLAADRRVEDVDGVWVVRDCAACRSPPRARSRRQALRFFTSAGSMRWSLSICSGVVTPGPDVVDDEIDAAGLQRVEDRLVHLGDVDLLPDLVVIELADEDEVDWLRRI